MSEKWLSLLHRRKACCSSCPMHDIYGRTPFHNKITLLFFLLSVKWRPSIIAGVKPSQRSIKNEVLSLTPLNYDFQEDADVLDVEDQDDFQLLDRMQKFFRYPSEQRIKIKSISWKRLNTRQFIATDYTRLVAPNGTYVMRSSSTVDIQLMTAVL